MTRSTPTCDIDELLRHAEWIRALARRLVQDEAARDDLVQETWLAVLTKETAVVADLKGWLSRVVRNALLQQHRSGSRRRKRERLAARAEALPRTLDLAAEAEQQRELVGALLALDEPYRGALLQKYFEGLSAAEIAARAGIPTSTVRSRINRGLGMLRERYDQRFDGNRSAWVGLLIPLARRGDAASSLSLRIVAGALLMNLKFASIVALVAVAGVSAVLWTTGDPSGEPRAPADADQQLSRTAVAAPVNAAAETTTEQSAEVVREQATAEPLATAAAAVQDPDRVGLVGTVDEATGERILLAGARITAVARDEQKSFQRTEHVVYSDEHGAFHVPAEVPRDGTCRLLAELHGYSPHHVGYLKDVVPLLPLVPSAIVYGRVVNRDTGNPIVGATVRQKGQMGRFCEPMLTDASGDYRFDDARSKGTFKFTVQAPRGYSVTQEIGLEGPGEYRRDVSMTFGPLLRGRVTDLETGRPIVGATVAINRRSACVTEEAGTFELFLPPERKITITVLAEGFCTSGRKFDPAQMNVDEEARFPLVRACTLEGIVLGFDGRPEKGAWVSAGRVRVDATRDGESRLKAILPEGTIINPVGAHSCRSDEEGRFALTGLRPFVVYESVEVRDGKAGRVMAVEPLSFTRSGETQSITVQFRSAAEIHGRVTWNGEGVRATIDSHGGKGRTVAGDDGRYQLELTEAGLVKITARAGTVLTEETVEIHLTQGEKRRLDFTFSGEINRVEGRLLTASGQPVPRAQVNLRWGDAHMGNGTRSDKDGRFSARVPLPPGQTVSARVHHGPVRLTRNDLIVGEAQNDIILPSLGTVLLRVVDEETGTPVTEVSCDWRETGTEEYRWLMSHYVKQRHDGTLALTLPVGSVDLRINHRRSDDPGVTAANVQSALNPDTTPVVVRLPSK